MTRMRLGFALTSTEKWPKSMKSSASWVTNIYMSVYQTTSAIQRSREQNDPKILWQDPREAKLAWQKYKNCMYKYIYIYMNMPIWICHLLSLSWICSWTWTDCINTKKSASLLNKAALGGQNMKSTTFKSKKCTCIITTHLNIQCFVSECLHICLYWFVSSYTQISW